MTAEQQERLERLKAAVKVISDHEDALEAALDADVRVNQRVMVAHVLPQAFFCHAQVRQLLSLARHTFCSRNYSTCSVRLCGAWLQAAAAEARRHAALRGDVPRDPGHVRMEELRALQQTALTDDDEAARFRAAQAVKPVRQLAYL